MINTDLIIETLCYADDSPNSISEIEKEFGCKIVLTIEKHNVLQHTYFYEIDFGKEENFYVEIESGINNGTQVNHSEWGVSTLKKTKIVEVLEDVVFDESAFDSWYGKGKGKATAKRKAKKLFEENKNKILELHRNKSYDNYVKGRDRKISDSYEKEFSKLSKLGVFWKYIYKEKEVYCNLI